MNFLDIAKTVGAAAFSVAVPGGAAILATVNQLLPDEHKLPATATGHDIRGAVSALPPEQQAAILEKQFDVDVTQIKESHDTVRTMLTADAASTHTTRPHMALGSFYLVAFVTVVIVLGWLYAVSKSADPLKEITDGWPFILALLGPFVTLMHAYFGVLKQEHRARLNGGAPAGIGGIIAGVLSRR